MVCVWPTFQEKKTEGVGKDLQSLAYPTRGTLIPSLHIPFIDHLSRDTSGSYVAYLAPVNCVNTTH